MHANGAACPDGHLQCLLEELFDVTVTADSDVQHDGSDQTDGSGNDGCPSGADAVAE